MTEWNRRKFLKKMSTLGPFAYWLPEFSDVARSLNSSFGQSRDAFETLTNISQNNAHRYSSSAFAQTPLNNSSDETTIITIKVMNMIHSPLCFKFSDYSGSLSGFQGTWAQKINSSETHELMINKGVDRPSSDPRFAQIKLNDWFGSLLKTGRDETGNSIAIESDTPVFSQFPLENEVAVQAFMHLDQNNATLNHSFKNTTLQGTNINGIGGDINYHLDQQGLISSPLGIACLNMGGPIETTDGMGRVPNRVLSQNLSTAVSVGRSVTDYVGLLEQSIGLGFVDESMVQKFDSLVPFRNNLRDALSENRKSLAQKLIDLQKASELETMLHIMSINNAANSQMIAPSQPGTAKMEFLSQCLLAKRVLDLPGKPIRNFSLLLNIYDLDARKLDAIEADGATRPLSYIEGMRQLALGLNMLAQTIKKHKNVYVAVVSEGGRGARGEDNKVSHGLLLGPGGAGNLKDHIYVNQATLADSTDTFHSEQNAGNSTLTTPGLTSKGAGLRPYDSGELHSESGTLVTDQYPTVGSMLHGLVRHLAEKKGVVPVTSGLGNFIKLQKG